MLYTVYLTVIGIFPIWYRLGLALSRRKIAIFADDQYNHLRDLLVDSKIFRSKNILRIDKMSIKKAESISILLVHWKSYSGEFDRILKVKKDSDALIIYAPQDEGRLSKETLSKINLERNSLIVNFRGRLLNDILTCMITTPYEKK